MYARRLIIITVRLENWFSQSRQRGFFPPDRTGIQIKLTPGDIRETDLPTAIRYTGGTKRTGLTGYYTRTDVMD